MKIISINAGSSSLKFTLFEMKDEEVIASGLFERIGMDGSCYTIKYNGEVITETIDLPNHTESVRVLLDKLIALNIVRSYDEIAAVGHRILHGKDIFKESTLLLDSVVDQLEELVDIGPLHMKANIAGIRAFREVLPNAPMVGVFDTAFYQTLEEEAYLYPVPYNWYTDYGIRKYGFHGTSHQYITEQVENILKKDHYKLISCHIGNGVSISAIKDGKCVDTSMGFTPLAGAMMGTRCGDIDPSIIPYVMEKEGKNASEVLDDLNRRSGMLGLSEATNDMRDIIDLYNQGDEKAIRAVKKYVRRIVDYIAQYYVLLEGADILVFTAGIGEKNPVVRREICERLKPLGIKIDLELNKVRGELQKISTEDSSVMVYVVPTDEELKIARETLNLINR